MAVYRVYKTRDGKYNLSATLSTKGGVVAREIKKDISLAELAQATRDLADLMQEGRVAAGMAEDRPSVPEVT